MLNYRLAPEHPFPAAPDDCLEAYRWLLEQGHPGRRIVLAGDSAGGNLGLGLLLRLRELGLALPACSVVLSPLTDATFSGDSVERNEGLDPMFTSRAFGALAPLYLPKGDPRTEPLVSPLFATLDGLPPVLLLVGSSELLLDDSVRFATRCPSAELQVWHGMPHVFALFDFLPEARRALDGIAAFVRAQLAASGAEGAAESASEPEAAAPEADVTAALAQPPAERATRARWRWLWSLALAAIAVFAVLRACADGPMVLP